MSNTNQSSSTNDLSIQQQLAERRARLNRMQQRQDPIHPNQINSQQPIRPSSAPMNNNNNNNESQHLSDYQFAMQLQQQFDEQHDNNDDDIQMSNNQQNRKSQHSHSAPSETIIDEDHEIALQLQRQFDSEHQSAVSQPSSNHNANNQNSHYQQAQMQSMGSSPHDSFFQFSSSNSNNNNNNFPPSSSSMSYSVTTTDNNGVRTVHFGNNGNGMSNHNVHNSNNDPFAVFNHPFFTQNRRNVNVQSNSNNNNNNNDPFNDPFFQQTMPPMVNMNMMINNMMMGNDGGMGPMGMMMPFGLMMQPRPRVADQTNVDALPTDTYQINQNSHEQKEGDKEEEDSEEKEVQSCSICLEPFKNGDTIKRLPCMHIFHQNEIDRWLLTGNDKCPICRIPINGQQNGQ